MKNQEWGCLQLNLQGEMEPLAPSRPLEDKERRTLGHRLIYTTRKKIKINGINLKRI